MDQIIQELVEVANILDNKGHSSFADIVDKVANTALDVKVAQYVGVQGYWIRNTRCWGNCIRQKRANSPTKPTQEVWSDCHKEYLNSLGSPNSVWDRYAGSSDKMIKSSEAKQYFHKSLQSKVNNKIASGSDVREAVLASLEEQKNEHFDKLIAASNDLLKIADKLSSDDLDLSLRTASAASGLSKAARWWHPADWMGGAGDWANKNRAEHARNLQQKSQDYSNRERGRNNPFLNGPSAATAGPPGGTAGPSGGTVRPPGGTARPSGGTARPSGGSPSGVFDGDGMLASPPVGSSGGTSKMPQGNPASLVGKDELGPETFAEETINLIPGSSFDEMNSNQIKAYYLDLLKGQERINSQISSIRSMFGSGYRKDKGWGDQPSVPEAGAPTGAINAPMGSGPDGAISGPMEPGSAGAISGPMEGFSQPNWASNTKPRKRLHPQPTASIV